MKTSETLEKIIMQVSRSNPQTIRWESGVFSTTRSINTSNRSHLYQLNLSAGSGFNLMLRSLKSSVQATIALDQNRNGRIDPRETIAQVRSREALGTLSKSNLRSGMYLIRVSPTQAGDARYRLSLKPAAPTSSGVARSTNSFVNQVLQLTNAFRQQHGLNPLRLNTRLTTAAQQHSRNMAVQDFFAHRGQDGSTPQSRGRAAGYQGGVGENIAAGFTSARSVVQGWINSPGHRANLLNRSYRDIGIGFFDNPSDRGQLNYRFYWTQKFGAPMR